MKKKFSIKKQFYFNIFTIGFLFILLFSFILFLESFQIEEKEIFNDTSKKHLSSEKSLWELLRDRGASDEEISMCVPHWSCGYWSECKVRYNLSELVFKDNSQIILYGLREKSCYDLRNCVFPILKTKICKELIDVDILRTVDRGVSIYSIKDRNTGEIVVKIRKGLRDDLPFLDINL